MDAAHTFEIALPSVIALPVAVPALTRGAAKSRPLRQHTSMINVKVPTSSANSLGH